MITGAGIDRDLAVKSCLELVCNQKRIVDYLLVRVSPSVVSAVVPSPEDSVNIVGSRNVG